MIARVVQPRSKKFEFSRCNGLHACPHGLLRRASTILWGNYWLHWRTCRSPNTAPVLSRVPASRGYFTVTASSLHSIT